MGTTPSRGDLSTGDPGSAPSDARRSPSLEARVACRACGRVIDEGDVFCRHCGKRQASSEAWFYQPFWILVLAFLVLGPFVLPLAWLSPKMTYGAKVGLTVIVLVYTGLLLYFTFALVVFTLHQFSELADLQGLM